MAYYAIWHTIEVHVLYRNVRMCTRSRKEHAQHSINGWLHTQDAGEVAQGADASVGYGVHHCKALVSANCQPEQ